LKAPWHRYALHLARGDRRGFVVVHHSGEPMSLTRYGDLKKRDIEWGRGTARPYSVLMRGGRGLAAHLSNSRDNDHVELHELRGFASADLLGAFLEVEAAAAATRCRQPFFSVSISPRPSRLFRSGGTRGRRRADCPCSHPRCRRRPAVRFGRGYDAEGAHDGVAHPPDIGTRLMKQARVRP